MKAVVGYAEPALDVIIPITILATRIVVQSGSLNLTLLVRKRCSLLRMEASHT